MTAAELGSFLLTCSIVCLAAWGFFCTLWYLCLTLAGWLVEAHTAFKKRPPKPKPKIRWLKLLINPPCPVCGHGTLSHKEDNYGYNYVERGGCFAHPQWEVVKSYDGALLTERDVDPCKCSIRPGEIRTHYRLAHRQRKGAA